MRGPEKRQGQNREKEYSIFDKRASTYLLFSFATVARCPRFFLSEIIFIRIMKLSKRRGYPEESQEKIPKLQLCTNLERCSYTILRSFRILNDVCDYRNYSI